MCLKCIYIARNEKKNPFKSNVPYFHASDLKTDCVSFKIFWQSLLRIFNGTLFWIKGEKIILPWLELRRVGTVFKLI